MYKRQLRQGEPSQKESAENWKTAIGLQAVDGLQPSAYLIDVAKRNIEGEITLDETRKLIDSYYQSKTVRTPKDEDEEEADKVSANIAKILASKTFAFNTNGYVSLHRRIFEGVFKHAGEIRQYDISKKEWVLEGDSVNYLNWEDLRRALDWDIEQEKNFSYKGLTDDEKIEHIAQHGRLMHGVLEVLRIGKAARQQPRREKFRRSFEGAQNTVDHREDQHQAQSDGHDGYDDVGRAFSGCIFH